MTKIKKAVIPVAGFGTRFLPVTKAQPKEMLPIVDKPSVQYAVEEAVRAGIKDIILITGYSKRAIEDHFDSNFELECNLKAKKKNQALRTVQKITRLANFIYIRQKKALGNGHAVLCAKSVIGKEPFVVIWPDDLIDSNQNCIQQMIDVFYQYTSPVVGVLKVPKKDVSKYGIIGNKHIRGNVHEVLSIIEKPDLKKAPSQLAILKGYVLTPEIFDILEKLKPGKGGEIWLADAVLKLLKTQSVFACEFKGKVYDVGSKAGWLKANIAYALKHPELKEEIKKFLAKDLKKI
ncbi:MAG: UTP--glucose-1-phosphate uridylyltransferase [Candidatus Kerfeldbacteria bacterium CG_4_10_14_0_8_um_filter_42_10]|uniref:UTP--glucose-1-phosphate uridylyltransferase n=1 Tax=Candidatus Kerfeldbacteria bacterium CG_4_10_14_0_8_um_filter_42_10 TaxID=2014248 RepID=A0A2M7RKE8_9BACT|nr:MAG: UTP--glucose-1-phosphate uridylyltransferase [Candidatus Kerfeldbacteria bacterium CG_4_10_14_0_8_um_filter_42_10]